MMSVTIPNKQQQATAPACDHAPARLSWARLLKRFFDIDIEHCPNCGGSLNIAHSHNRRIELIDATDKPTRRAKPLQCGTGFNNFWYVALSSEIFCKNSCCVMMPFSISSFASDRFGRGWTRADPVTSPARVFLLLPFSLRAQFSYTVGKVSWKFQIKSSVWMLASLAVGLMPYPPYSMAWTIPGHMLGGEITYQILRRDSPSRVATVSAILKN